MIRGHIARPAPRPPYHREFRNGDGWVIKRDPAHWAALREEVEAYHALYFYMIRAGSKALFSIVFIADEVDICEALTRRVLIKYRESFEFVATVSAWRLRGIEYDN